MPPFHLYSPVMTVLQPDNIKNWFDDRAGMRALFVERCGWAEADFSPVGEDCAFRRYFRLRKGDGKTAVLMEAVPDDAPMATPGHKIGDFIRIGYYLRKIGLNTPAVYDADETTGYVLMEDFGDTSFKTAREQGADNEALYGLATDVLSALAAEAAESTIDLPDYYASHVHKGRQRVVDWFMPAVRQEANPDGLVESYLAVWQKIEQDLPPCPQGFLHIDYHAENLMYLPSRKGLFRCGILDFQGAMRGPVPYDLANFLEDVRIDVPEDIRHGMLARFCRDMTAEERESFMAWYRILAMQFHCRVAGQFIRLAVRDGKPRYLAYLPRVCRYIREGLSDPVLTPLAAWFAAQGIDFQLSDIGDVSAVSAFIRDDAF